LVVAALAQLPSRQRAAMVPIACFRQSQPQVAVVAAHEMATVALVVLVAVQVLAALLGLALVVPHLQADKEMLVEM
jgi:hypothetical protein